MEVVVSLLKAFGVGGLICVVGQLLLDYTKITPARILVGFVVAGVFLGTVGIYEHVVEFAGAGATVPLTGFGYLLSEGVRKAIMQDGLVGILKGGLTAGAAGISVAILFGMLVALIFNPKKK